jgi:acetyl esterase/lipase
MKRPRGASTLAAAIVLSMLAPHAARAQAGSGSSAVDEAFAAFWAAADPGEALARVDAVVASGVSFDDALARLRRGRAYSASAPRGRRDLSHDIRGGRVARGGLTHPYTIIVPEGYDPTRAYPVRVQLHGGVGRPLRDPGQAAAGATRIPGTIEQIYVLPNSWPESMWWEENQSVNIAAILDRLKRAYNVDENRVDLTGISDGGSGAYFYAFRAPTPFASFLPLNGQMLVLGNPTSMTDGEIFPGNAVNRPFLVVNGGQDQLYPAHQLAPFVEHLADLGAEVVFHVQEEAGHNTQWWPEERASFEAFVEAHPRNPFPDKLSWQTERVDRYNRVDWLVVDRLRQVEGEADLPDSNLMRRFRRPVFRQSGESGRVDLVRRGNTVEASTRGVRSLTLLLAPAQFDFAQPVTVVVNGRTAFQGRVTPSVKTLLEWAARDNDRTALYGAAVRIEVGK